MEASYDPELMGGCVRILASGYRDEGGGEASAGRSPYATYDPRLERRRPVKIEFVPYHLWGNRSPGNEMRVWLRGLVRS